MLHLNRFIITHSLSPSTSRSSGGSEGRGSRRPPAGWFVLGRGSTSLCECLFGLVRTIWLLDLRVHIQLLCYISVYAFILFQLQLGEEWEEEEGQKQKKEEEEHKQKEEEEYKHKEEEEEHKQKKEEEENKQKEEEEYKHKKMEDLGGGADTEEGGGGEI